MCTAKFNKESNQGVNARSDAQETKKILGRYRILNKCTYLFGTRE